jgi:hypothetical protein
MSDISPELRNELSARAEPHYPDVLAYHNWEHAVDMMSIIGKLASKSINPAIRDKQNVLVVTAAWHDADYAIEELGAFKTKEERSAVLAVESLPELSDEDKEIVYSAIIDTTVGIKPKGSIFGELAHTADVGYFAASPTHFMGRLSLMREEWGSPSWEETVSRTVRFGHMVMEESKEVLPNILSESDSDAWVGRIERNLLGLQMQLESGRLK